MEGFSFVTPVTGLNRPNTGKDDDDDDDEADEHVAHVQLLYEEPAVNEKKCIIFQIRTRIQAV
jgi:hypothetical protein